MRGVYRIATAALVFGLSCGAAQSIELVTNGGFETGDFTGWTASVSPSLDGVDTNAPHTGTYGAFFGNLDTSTISETISTTSGATYHLSFWLQVELDALGNATPNSFSASFGGANLKSLSDMPAQAYTEYTFDVVATGSASILSFSFSNTPAFFDFDDVSLTQASATPLPAALPLFASGLGALGLLGWRRKRKDAAAIAA